MKTQNRTGWMTAACRGVAFRRPVRRSAERIGGSLVAVGLLALGVVGEARAGFWTPAQMTTALWLAADDLDGDGVVEGSGESGLASGDVATWVDKSGNGRNATGTVRPTYTAGGLNGLHVVTFDGADNGDILKTSYNLPNNYSIVLVSKKTTQTSASASGVRPLVAATTTGSKIIAGVGTWRVGMTSPNVHTLDVLIDTTRVTPIENSWPDNDVLIASCTYDGSTLSAWKNGSAYSTPVSHAKTGFGQVQIGGTDDVSVRRFAGTLAEVVILSSSATISDRQKLEGYMAWKWGLQANLPAGHPYKSAAPTDDVSATIQNQAASNVTTNGATFNGMLVNTGMPPADVVYALWGDDTNSWANTNAWTGGGWTNNTPFSTNITTLSANQNYYYTFGASNATTNVVADSPRYLITGEVSVEATDPTGRVTAVDTITFAASRPAACTNEDLVLNYTLGGTATNGTDYTIAPVSGAVAIARGQTSGTILVTPVWKNDAQKTVILSLASGGYIIGAASSATGTLAVVSRTPTTRTWVGGSGTWDDLTPGNWSPAAVPFNGDTVNLTTSSGALVDIGYTTVGLSGSGLAQLTIGNAGGGMNRLNLDGSDSLPTDRFTLNPGGAVDMSGGTLGAATATATSLSQLNGGTFTISGGVWRARIPANGALQVGHSAATGPVVLNLNGSGSISVAGSSEQNLAIGNSATHTAELNQSGGAITVPFYVRIYTKGTYVLSGGTLTASSPIQVNGGGTFSQSGGTASSTYGVTINGTLNLSGGDFYVNSQGNDVLVGAGGTVNYLGGRFRMSAGTAAIRNLKLTGAGASWNMQGTTLTVNDGGHGGTNSLVTVAGSTIQGYGTIQDVAFPSQPDWKGTINNSGRVIANGYGTDRTLDMSRIFYVANLTDNATSNGWFAVSGGRLLLPTIAVSAGSSVTNWAEAPADTDIDLVNSARIAFTGATAGNLTGALLAVDRSDVPAGLYRPAAVWTFGGITCTTATLTFRYDDAAAAALGVAEADLLIWRHNGTKWLEITATRDTGTKTITSQASGSLASTTFFAVAGKVPPSGTVISIR